MALADVSSVRCEGRRVRIAAREGEALDVPATSLLGTTIDPHAQALVERLEHACAPTPQARWKALASTTGSTADAIDVARAWATSGEDFRAQPATVDDLIAAIESPAAPMRLRVLAAVALDARLRDAASASTRDELARVSSALLGDAFAALVQRIGTGDAADVDALATTLLAGDDDEDDQATAAAGSATDVERASR
jgi:hypothetical protein